MTNTKAKYFWAEPDGGADLRLSLPLDCFWEAPGYNSGITVRLSQEGASVRRLTTVRFLEFEARFRRAFLPAVSDEQFCGHCVTEELWHAFSCRLCPFLEGEAAEQAFDRRSHPSVLGMYHLRFSEFYRFDFRPPAPPHQGIADIYKFYQIDGFQPFQAAFFRGSGDFYFVDPDFEWAYIVTHEPELGPYFVTKAT